jgi:hypothetical protein
MHRRTFRQDALRVRVRTVPRSLSEAPSTALFAAGCCFLLAACAPWCGRGRAGEACPPAAALVALPDISGTYALTAISGTALPYTVTHEPPGVRVTWGVFLIQADGTCSTRSTLVLPTGEVVNREVNATWTRAGSTLTMLWEGAGTTTATVAGEVLTMDNEGLVFEYRKMPEAEMAPRAPDQPDSDTR